ncbi:6177_t:CDS:1, partial [Dentiscutata erythropus]
AKYQYKVPLQINIRFGISRIQSNRPKTNSFSQHLSEYLSDYEDKLLEDELLEDEIFLHLTGLSGLFEYSKY